MKSIRFISLLAFIAALSIATSGCLTTELKEYRFQVNNDGSGTGSIKFVNIVSEDESEKDVSAKDFDELINGYIKGTAFEDENPAYGVTDKKLFEENGQLMGEITFTFKSLDSIGFYLDDECKCCKRMFYLGEISESLIESNGKYLGENRDFPVLAWDDDIDEFYFKVSVKEGLANSRSLLSHYNSWQKEQ